jgi:hypothetical protein
MLNSSQNTRLGAPKRCAVCEGPFGLIRHYSCRTPPVSALNASRTATRGTANGCADFKSPPRAGRCIGSATPGARG